MASRRGVVFVGAGNMGTAIIGGLDLNRWEVTAVDRYEDQLESISRQFAGVKTSMALNESIIEGVDVVVLAIKPQSLQALVPIIANFDFSNKIVVSIMSGVTLAEIESSFPSGSNIKYMRVMPNMPIMIGKGVTGVHLNRQDKDWSSLKSIAEGLFGSKSHVYFFDREEDLNLVTAISGSGPAYFLAFIEALVEAAISIGIEPAVANQMSIQTALGAAFLASNSGKSVQELRESITSKGGTTYAALKSFEESDLNGAVHRAVSSALERAIQLQDQQHRTSSK